MFSPYPSPQIDALDQGMRAALADSLDHIRSAAGAVFECSDIESEPDLRAIREHRVAPGVFGCYYELVSALQSQNYDESRRLWREICARAGASVSPQVVPFTDAALGEDARRFARLLDLTATEPRLLGPPSAASWATFPELVAKARALLAAAEPALVDEVDGLVAQVIGASPPQGATNFRFGGASSFMLWGAVFLNVDRHRTVLDTLEGLVHEAAHLLLFGLFRDAPPVLNGANERYDSPLRRTGRPMIGVYHATFVCARLHHLYRRLLATHPAMEDAHRIETRIDQQRRLFLQGHATVQDHARLTDAGRRLMAAAHAAVVSAD